MTTSNLTPGTALPSLDDIRAYMTRTGWTVASSASLGQIWRHKAPRRAVSMLWSANPGSAPWAGVIDRLAQAEDRAYADVLASILTTDPAKEGTLR